MGHLIGQIFALIFDLGLAAVVAWIVYEMGVKPLYRDIRGRRNDEREYARGQDSAGL